MRINEFNIKFSQNFSELAASHNNFSNNYSHHFDSAFNKYPSTSTHTNNFDIEHLTTILKENTQYKSGVLANFEDNAKLSYSYVPVTKPAAEFTHPKIETPANLALVDDKTLSKNKEGEDNPFLNIVFDLLEETLDETIESLLEVAFGANNEEDKTSDSSEVQVHYNKDQISELFIGSSGNDILQYSGLSSSYEIIKSDSSYFVKNNSSNEVDILVGIETIKFVDTTVSLDGHNKLDSQDIGIVGQYSNAYFHNISIDSL